VSATRDECLAAHADENLLVGGDVLGIEMPMPVGHAGFVERVGLRGGGPDGERRSEQQSCKYCRLHGCLLLRKLFACWPAIKMTAPTGGARRGARAACTAGPNAARSMISMRVPQGSVM
jgi:hypothetical protein